MPVATATTTVTRRGNLAEPSEGMLALLDRIKSGGVLVVGYRKTPRQRRFAAEVDGEPVPPSVARGLIERGLVALVSKTSRTETYGPAEGRQ